MTGQELVKFYDNVVNADVLTSLVESVKTEDHRLWVPDQPFQDDLDKPLFDYMTTFPGLTKNWTFDLDLGTYEAVVEADQGPKVASYVEGGGQRLCTMVLFTTDTRSVEFPQQGIQVDGLPGRAVIFPAHWTHPYQLLGTGDVLVVHYHRGDRLWNDSPRVAKSQQKMKTV